MPAFRIEQFVFFWHSRYFLFHIPRISAWLHFLAHEFYIQLVRIMELIWSLDVKTFSMLSADANIVNYGNFEYLKFIGYLVISLKLNFKYWNCFWLLSGEWINTKICNSGFSIFETERNEMKNFSLLLGNISNNPLETLGYLWWSWNYPPCFDVGLFPLSVSIIWHPLWKSLSWFSDKYGFWCRQR